MTGTNIEIIRAADEGVPIGALVRIFSQTHASAEIRRLLCAAVSSGRLLEVPTEDWPLGVARSQRAPCVAKHMIGEDDGPLVIRMAQRLKTTKLESRIMLVVLRRGHATRTQLHETVEFNRGNPAQPTDIKIVDVVVCKLRKKIALLGLTLHTIHSIGYEMSRADCLKAWSIINGEVP